MTRLTPTDLHQIEVFSHWIGFASPPSRSEKLIITRQNAGFIWEWLPEGQTGTCPLELIQQLFAVLSRPAVKEFDAGLFDFPAPVMQHHYNSLWTDDYPSVVIRLIFEDARLVNIKSDVQQAFMLPLQLHDSFTGIIIETYNPNLSETLAALLPNDFMHKARLAGQEGMLQWDLKKYEEIGEQAFTEKYLKPPDAKANKPLSQVEIDALWEEFSNILSNVESPEEKAQAEREGSISERLLRNIPLNDVRDLLARGADPNIADDVDQTALMHAAFPPLDREKFWLLVEAGANLEARRQGATGLHITCAGGEDEAVAEWVRAGANIDARTPDGATPLMLGATWPKIVRLLLDAGVEVNARDEDGCTALIYAICNQQIVEVDRQLQAIRLLLEAGADVNCPDNEGATALTYACHKLEEARVQEEVITVLHQLPGNEKGPHLKLAMAVVQLLELVAEAD